MDIKQIHPLFAGEVGGIDLRRPPSAEQVAAIDRAMDRYAVLVFRGQPLSQDEQIQFASAFGDLDIGLAKLSKTKGRLDYPELIDISNVARDGSIAPSGDKRIAGALANQLWHSDSSFQAVPGKYSMLSAVVLPGPSVMGAGETEFADMRAAYDALSEGMKAKLEGLVAEHYALYSRMWLGDEDWTPEQKAGMPPVRWKIVRTQSYGRKSLFIGAHANRIVGWPHVSPRPAGACDATAIRLSPRMATRRSGDLGQPRHTASRPPLRHEPAPRIAPHHHRRFGDQAG